MTTNNINNIISWEIVDKKIKRHNKKKPKKIVSPEFRFYKLQRYHIHRHKKLNLKSVDFLTYNEWKKILKTQRNRCACCGCKFDKETPPTIDHIIPVSRGGPFTFENIQALCARCNNIKYDNVNLSMITSWIFPESDVIW